MCLLYLYCVAATRNEESLSLPPSPKREKVPKLEIVESDNEVEECPKTSTCDASVMADMSSEARFIMNELNALQDVSRVDCL